MPLSSSVIGAYSKRGLLKEGLTQRGAYSKRGLLKEGLTQRGAY